LEDIVVLRTGAWKPGQLRVLEIPCYPSYPEFSKTVEAEWQKTLAKNPQAFSGLCLRLAGHHLIDDRLVLEVIHEEYKNGQVFGWIGVFMSLLTKDGYLAMQMPKESIGSSIGRGIRIPGCTPTNADISNHVVREVREEFGTKIDPDSIIYLGLLETFPPVSWHHYALVSLIEIPLTKEELQKNWGKAEDRWEGDLAFIKVDEKGRICFDKINPAQIQQMSRVALDIISKYKFDR
jgi:8-oxo-dGTP pyrophosphatase MutT (NUDIX family)